MEIPCLFHVFSVFHNAKALQELSRLPHGHSEIFMCSQHALISSQRLCRFFFFLQFSVFVASSRSQEVFRQWNSKYALPLLPFVTSVTVSFNGSVLPRRKMTRAYFSRYSLQALIRLVCNGFNLDDCHVTCFTTAFWRCRSSGKANSGHGHLPQQRYLASYNYASIKSYTPRSTCT